MRIYTLYHIKPHAIQIYMIIITHMNIYIYTGSKNIKHRTEGSEVI